MTTLSLARSLLFVPGSRPDRFDKAVGTGADVVVIDLEDAVSPDGKVAALQHARAWLALGHEALVRINPIGTPWHEAEVTALAGLALGVIVPKAERPADLAEVVDGIGAGHVIAQLETPRGVRAADDLAEVTGLARLAFGNIDLAAALGVSPTSSPALTYARSRLVLASAAAHLPAPVDGVTTALDDETTLTDDLAHARELGFTGRFCLHPRQVAPTNHALSATDEELGWARRVVAANTGEGVSMLDGEMVDAPVLARARALLRQGPRPPTG